MIFSAAAAAIAAASAAAYVDNNNDDDVVVDDVYDEYYFSFPLHFFSCPALPPLPPLLYISFIRLYSVSTPPNPSGSASCGLYLFLGTFRLLSIGRVLLR